jgi:hypothetical protein
VKAADLELPFCQGLRPRAGYQQNFENTRRVGAPEGCEFTLEFATDHLRAFNSVSN